MGGKYVQHQRGVMGIPHAFDIESPLMPYRSSFLSFTNLYNIYSTETLQCRYTIYELYFFGFWNCLTGVVCLILVQCANLWVLTIVQRRSVIMKHYSITLMHGHGLRYCSAHFDV